MPTDGAYQLKQRDKAMDCGHKMWIKELNLAKKGVINEQIVANKGDLSGNILVLKKY